MSHYVKFTYHSAHADIAHFEALAALNACRRKLQDCASLVWTQMASGTAT
jgi:hypothetical protein